MLTQSCFWLALDLIALVGTAQVGGDFSPQLKFFTVLFGSRLTKSCKVAKTAAKNLIPKSQKNTIPSPSFYFWQPSSPTL